MRSRLIAFFGLLSLALAPVAPTVAAAADDYSITASGTWRSNDGLLSGPWTAHFNVAGFDLSGTLDIIGLPGVASANIAGSWDLDDIGFGVLFLDQEVATFDGGLEGNEFVGNFEAGDIDGIWSGALDSLSLSSSPITPILEGDLPTVLLDRISGNAGDLKYLGAKLHTFGKQIVQIESLLNFDANIAQILPRLDGKPDCLVNAAIDKADTIFQFLPKGCAGKTCTQVRSVVRSVSNLAAIADGAQLFTCKVRIGKTVESGIYQVVAQAVSAVDTSLRRLPFETMAGEIAVKAKSVLGLGDCHCRTVDEAGTLPLASLLAPLLLLVARRRRDRLLMQSQE